MLICNVYANKADLIQGVPIRTESHVISYKHGRPPLRANVTSRPTAPACTDPCAVRKAT